MTAADLVAAILSTATDTGGRFGRFIVTNEPTVEARCRATPDGLAIRFSPAFQLQTRVGLAGLMPYGRLAHIRIEAEGVRLWLDGVAIVDTVETFWPWPRPAMEAADPDLVSKRPGRPATTGPPEKNRGAARVQGTPKDPPGSRYHSEPSRFQTHFVSANLVHSV